MSIGTYINLQLVPQPVAQSKPFEQDIINDNYKVRDLYLGNYNQQKILFPWVWGYHFNVELLKDIYLTCTSVKREEGPQTNTFQVWHQQPLPQGKHGTIWYNTKIYFCSWWIHVSILK